MTPKKQVSPVIRISRGERDASARATHLEAATRKFLVTTNEGTQMSTTTNFKRIALVAVAALGLGVLSSAPSQAVIPETSIAVTTAAGTSGQTKGAAGMDSSTAGTVSLSFTATAADSVSVTVIPKAKPADSLTDPRLLLMLVDTATSSGATTVGVTTPLTYTSQPSASESNTTTSVKAASNTIAAAKFFAFIDTATLSTSRTAGTYTWTVAVTPYSANFATQIGNTGVVYKDISITVAAEADQSLVIDPTKSTAFLNTTAGQTSDAAISAVATASATAAGVLTVKTYNSSSVARDESVTVSIAGAGVLNVGSVSGTSLVLASTAGVTDINVRPDGRAGVATISVSTPTRTFSSKSITFYAAAAKTITATVGTPLLAVGANAGAVRGVAVDATGVAWTGTAYIVASSAADALVAGSATTPVSCGAYDTVNQRHNCPVTAIAVGTAKFKIIDAATVALATATSNEVTVTVSAASVASVKIEFDKATYAPNERARIYVTPLDATGKAMQSASYTSLFTSTGISVNGALSYTGTLTTADSLTAAGSITTAAQTSATTGARAGSMQYTVYMPAAGGVVTLNATGGTSLPLAAQVALTATATVTDSGAAALAAVNALATTVASLKTLITTLTNLVLKIQKKVKA
jgi:hypothetical protein